MTFELAVFVVLVFTTFFNNGVQAYIHFNAYPLLGHVGKTEFAGYLKAYEDRLMVPLLLPFGLSILSALILLFARPAGIEPFVVGLALVLIAGVAVVTMTLATPVYKRIKAAGEASAAELRPLMRVNLLRLILTTLSSVVVVYLLLVLLAA